MACFRCGSERTRRDSQTELGGQRWRCNRLRPPRVGHRRPGRLERSIQERRRSFLTTVRGGQQALNLVYGRLHRENPPCLW